VLWSVVERVDTLRADRVAVVVNEKALAPAVSVVLPCLNEARSVGLCVEEARTSLERGGLRGEVVVVDNGSTDGSPEIAARAGARVVHEERRGYGAALLAGFRAARHEIVVMADADHTYPLDKIPELVAPIVRDEADLVVGSRLDGATRHTMPLTHRYIGTPVLTFLSARACGGRVVNDSQSGFRAFRRETIRMLALRSTGMELASEMLIRGARAGLRIEEIPTGYRPRIGESKLATYSDGWRHLYLILLHAPDLLLIGPGATAFAIGLVLTILSFIQPAGIGIGSARWQPVFISSIALIVGLQALLAGAVLAYDSSVTAPSMQRRFDFVRRAKFANWCVGLGLALIGAGVVVELVLFFVWVDNSARPHTFAAASLAQSLIIVGGTLATFGVLSRVQRARVARHVTTPTVLEDRIARENPAAPVPSARADER
jgi:glycosyltransferase involved in cell wall biosynthesis